MRSFARLSFAILTALVMSVCFSATRTALAQTNGSSGIIISEFRFDGPAGTSDEFVEIVNNNSAPKTIVSSDANLAPHVGHKIEVTGTAVPAKEAEADAKVPKAAHYMKLTSIKMLSPMCP